MSFIQDYYCEKALFCICSQCGYLVTKKGNEKVIECTKRKILKSEFSYNKSSAMDHMQACVAEVGTS